jgi:hypothetical protein
LYLEEQLSQTERLNEIFEMLLLGVKSDIGSRKVLWLGEVLTRYLEGHLASGWTNRTEQAIINPTNPEF